MSELAANAVPAPLPEPVEDAGVSRRTLYALQECLRSALAAIQALYEIIEEKDARIAALEARLTALENRDRSPTADR